MNNTILKDFEISIKKYHFYNKSGFIKITLQANVKKLHLYSLIYLSFIRATAKFKADVQRIQRSRYLLHQENVSTRFTVKSY